MEESEEINLVDDERGLTIDELMTRLGGFGRYQWIIECVLSIQMFPYVFQILILYFGSMDPDWKCVSNSSSCLFNTTRSSYDTYRCSIPRSEWEYTTPKDFSFATEHDLNCGRKWMQHFLTSIIFVGWGIGAILFGYLADNYGRRLILLSCFSTLLLVSFLSSFVPNFFLMALCRFVIGMCIPGVQVQIVTILSEFVAPKERAKAVMIPGVLFTVSLCMLPLHAYFIRKWKTLLIVCSAPYFILIPFAIHFVPESVRWLRLKGKMDDATIILKQIAKCNKQLLPDKLLIEEVSAKSKENKTSVLDIFRTRTMAVRSISQGYIWLSSGMVYYALVLAASDLGGSVYLNFFLLTVVQIPSCIWAIDLCDRIGRKKTTIISMFIVGLSCIGIAVTPLQSSVKVLRVIFAMIGKFFLSIGFASIYLWATELYPTDIRTNGNGFLQVTSRIGAASASWVAKGLLTLHPSAPFILMAITSLLASAVTFLLPETKNVPTVETVMDIEKK